MIAGFYAALCALFFVALTIRIIKLRYRYKVGLNDGDQPELRQAIRAHGHFAEFVPLQLIMLFAMEQAGWQVWLLHGFGAALLAARVFHAWGLYKSPVASWQRMAGMIITFAWLIFAAGLLVWAYVGHVI